MEIAKLTAYQYGVLCHTAQGSVPIFLAARPRREDTPSRRYTLKHKHEEVKQLVELQLMEDVSDEFVETIQEHTIKTGRKYAVYGLTEQGYLLFRDCDDRPIN